MGVATVSKIERETIKVIWEKLQPFHMKIPDKNDFRKIAEDYYNIWNFPNCIGAVNGKPVRIICPAHSGSMFYNYKKIFTIVLQGLVDGDYKFINVEVGGYGKQSDGGTFWSSALFLYLSDGRLKHPDACALPNSEIIVPCVIISDEAYPLLPNLLKPYGRQQIDAGKGHFNARQSRLECALGIIYFKWRILGTAIQTSVDVADDIVKYICLLNNIIIDRGNIEHHLKEKITSKEISVASNNTERPNKTPENVRDQFKMYLCQNQISII